MSSAEDSDTQTKSRPAKKAKTDPATQGSEPTSLGKRGREAAEEEESTNAKEATKRPEVLTTSEGDSYIELGKQKRVTVRKFKGKVLIDIREFYAKSGEEKPGKKGISLTLEQWQALQSVSDDVNHLISQLS